MKFLIKLLLFILAAILAGLLVTRAAIAEAPYNQSEYSDDIIKDNAIVKTTPQTSISESRVSRLVVSTSDIRRHPIRAEKTISAEKLEEVLVRKRSPLSSYASRLVESPYWSTIIGICTIEEYGCTKAPGNNYWGIMCGEHLCRYETLSESISAISSILAKYEVKGKNTIEELNCYYVQPCSSNWLNTVIHTKEQLEAL